MEKIDRMNILDNIYKLVEQIDYREVKEELLRLDVLSPIMVHEIEVNI